MPVVWKLNQIPIALYLITHAYFTTYFVFANIIIRACLRFFTTPSNETVVIATVSIVLSWFYAFMETYSIESYPYYSLVDRTQMYKIGLTFYALYFVPAFPLFYRMDEKKGKLLDSARHNCLFNGNNSGIVYFAGFVETFCGYYPLGW